MKKLFYSLLAASALFAAPAQSQDAPSKAQVVLAGGCFWGVEAVFEHVDGVLDATSGYAGGSAQTAHYRQVGGGSTGHAEAVKITYDPRKVSLDTLLDVYFTVAHNPTQLNYQGPDRGTQYRSAVFYDTPEQKAVAEQKITQMQPKFTAPIVTTLESLEHFYPAEQYHQDFAKRNPQHPYILMHDMPKVSALKNQFANLYKM